jgi:hypothetical protein
MRVLGPRELPEAKDVAAFIEQIWVQSGALSNASTRCGSPESISRSVPEIGLGC